MRELTLSSGQSPPKHRVAKAAGMSRKHGHCGFWGLPSSYASHICSYGHTGRALREEFQTVTAACLGAQSCPADKKPKALASQVFTRLCFWSEWIPVAMAPHKCFWTQAPPAQPHRSQRFLFQRQLHWKSELWQIDLEHQHSSSNICKNFLRWR